MSNQEIITTCAVLHGIKGELHTFQGWKQRGYSVKKGEHGIECRLWKKRKPKKEQTRDEFVEEETVKGQFYLANAYLFSEVQVEKVEVSK